MIPSLYSDSIVFFYSIGNNFSKSYGFVNFMANASLQLKFETKSLRAFCSKVKFYLMLLIWPEKSSIFTYWDSFFLYKIHFSSTFAFLLKVLTNSSIDGLFLKMLLILYRQLFYVLLELMCLWRSGMVLNLNCWKIM